MDKLPQHCQENAITLKRNEYMNFEMMKNGHKTGFKFEKIPNFYIVDDKECFAVEMKTEGLKVGTATLATENMLNIKLLSLEDLSNVRNLNFLIPLEADAKQVSIEVLNDTIFIRAPLTSITKDWSSCSCLPIFLFKTNKVRGSTTSC
ncbi:unnamed protein product [Xylocopa violacea]|uniref:Uncharacterized protein n=1 Tax=Xylocopa violacea TaxID=135666 RepID=A0ABP1NFT3_XYLVO